MLDGVGWMDAVDKVSAVGKAQWLGDYPGSPMPLNAGLMGAPFLHSPTHPSPVRDRLTGEVGWSSSVKQV